MITGTRRDVGVAGSAGTLPGTSHPTIGIDAHSLVDRRTGASTYVQQLIAALGRLDAEVSIRLYLNTLPAEPLPFPTVEVAKTPLWTTLRLAGHFLVRPAPDVMLFPTHVMPLHAPMRSVVTILDLAFELFPAHFTARDRFRLRQTTRLSVRRADRLIAISESTSRDLQELYGVEAERISVIPLGYDESHSRPVPGDVERVRARYGLERPYVLCVGTLQKRKNHVRLLQALRLLLDRGLELDLVIVGGKGWLYDEIFAEVRRLRLEAHVRFLGYAEHADLPALYTGASASALVSLYEGFGLPVLESLACHTPVVVSNVSSLPEVGGDAVLTVDPLDSDDIAAKLEVLLTDGARRSELVRRIPQHLERFSWRKTAQDTLALLRDVAAR
jgi:glycosyltransferase involved in cell wall biosynthesis